MVETGDLDMIGGFRLTCEGCFNYSILSRNFQPPGFKPTA